MPFVLGRPSEATLTRIADDAQRLELSYAEVGVTNRASNQPTDLRVDQWSIDLDDLDDNEDEVGSFDRACSALRHWQAHRGAGARVFPGNPAIEVGTTVVVALSLPGFTAVAPCRIVWVVDEPDAFGFAYGTLVGHPERGEESFVVRREGGRVMFDIIAASRPAALLPRLGGPVARSLQKRVTRRYLAAIQQASLRPAV